VFDLLYIDFCTPIGSTPATLGAATTHTLELTCGAFGAVPDYTSLGTETLASSLGPPAFPTIEYKKGGQPIRFRYVMYCVFKMR
jgi:hypothetical protein